MLTTCAILVCLPLAGFATREVDQRTCPRALLPTSPQMARQSRELWRFAGYATLHPPDQRRLRCCRWLPLCEGDASWRPRCLALLLCRVVLYGLRHMLCLAFRAWATKARMPQKAMLTPRGWRNRRRTAGPLLPESR